MEATTQNPYEHTIQQLKVGEKSYKYYSLSHLTDKSDSRLQRLPYSIRVLLECAMRNCDEFNVKKADVETILNWEKTSTQSIEIPFKPARVILQDFTGVPLVVDLAAMRDAVNRLGGDPQKINPDCQVDLVVDHSIQVDFARSADAKEQNEALEFELNRERFQFLQWGQGAFENFSIVPPGSGIVHQVNLEYLAKAVYEKDSFLYFDSVVGTDSHTTMINGLGVLGWGVGGIEAQAVMLGQCTAMVLPEVVGFKLVGELSKTVTATDLVLTCTQILRKRGVVNKFVEFFGPGIKSLSLADRATVANMAPEYGATMGFFPVDEKTIDYLRQSARSQETCQKVKEYFQAQGLFQTYDGSQKDPVFSGEVIELDLSTVVPSVAGPKRPMDRVALSSLQEHFTTNLVQPIDNSAFGVSPEKAKDETQFTLGGEEYVFRHGTVVIAAITSCTNTSNPGVMLAAGLLAKNAVAKGLKVPKYVQTSLSPGSQIVTKYYEEAGVTKYLDELGFALAGYGCMTCIGNSGDIDPVLTDIIKAKDFVASAVLSGNRNFEGRVHPLTRANYLASPPLVVAFALAGNVNHNFETEPLGVSSADGQPVFLRDIWPSREEVEALAEQIIKPSMFAQNYGRISKGTDRWNSLVVQTGIQYEWKPASTYIHDPPFFQSVEQKLPEIRDIKDAYCLGLFGDSITTDHISPAGNISKNSSAGRFLLSKGVQQKDFNQYGTRRGNDEVMARGTFANTRIVNKILGGKVGPQTIHFPSGKEYDIYDAAELYMKENHQLIVIGGKEYGSGSSRDWAAKGPYLQGIQAVIAESYERIHRSNLIGMGILPLEFLPQENAESLGLQGNQQFSIALQKGDIQVGQNLDVTTDAGQKFTVQCRLDTEVEVNYFQHGGILHFVLRKLVSQK